MEEKEGKNPKEREKSVISQGDYVKLRETKRKGRWRDKLYSRQLIEYVNQVVHDNEVGVYRALFNELVEKFNLTRPNDLILLDLLCYDFIRAKRLQKILKEKGETTTLTTKGGYTIVKANEAAYLLNAVESQLRQTMKELMLTKKEETKKQLGMTGKDFATWLSENVVEVEATELVEDANDKKIVRQIRGRAKQKA